MKFLIDNAELGKNKSELEERLQIRKVENSLPSYRDASASSMTRHIGFLVEAPYNLTMLGCETLDNCCTSVINAFCSVAVLIFLTATTLERQTPL